MEIHEDTLEELMKMACLDLKDEQKKAMQADLSSMVLWIKKLQEVDTKGVKPIATLSHEINKFRSDEPDRSLSQKKALVNAPDAKDPYFCVPSVKN